MSRADEVWRLLARQILPGPVGLVREPGRNPLPVTCWPLSQVMHAAALLEPARWGVLRRGLGLYQSGPAFRESPLRGRRFYDDNAWLGLAAVAAGDRALAESIRGWLATGDDPATGGVRWVEGGDTVNACSTGGAALLRLQLGRSADPALDLLARLRRQDGVVADHLRADGSLDRAAFSYNQGLLIAAAQAAGRTGLCDEAIAAGEAYYTPERLWGQAVCFNAIYVRGLVAAGGPLAGVRHYADRLWAAGRDREGWFTQAGRYDAGRVLDAAGAAQIYALLDQAA